MQFRTEISRLPFIFALLEITFLQGEALDGGPRDHAAGAARADRTRAGARGRDHRRGTAGAQGALAAGWRENIQTTVQSGRESRKASRTIMQPLAY